MTESKVVTCSACDQRLVERAWVCPRCGETRNQLPSNVLKLSTDDTDNPVTAHTLVPKHEVLPESDIAKLREEYDIEVTDLPKIELDDPPLQGMNVHESDVVRIERDSRTTDMAVSYRLVTPIDDVSSVWKWSLKLDGELFEGDETVDADFGQHILGNLRGAQPPARPGGCLPIAVGREEEMQDALNRVEAAEPVTYVNGELGFGKSFFLRWLRDEVLPWAAVSVIDLSDDVNFNDASSIVTAFRSSLQTNRSVAGEPSDGVDEMWGQFLAGINRQIETELQERGFELKTKRVGNAVVEVVRTWLNGYDIPEGMRNAFVDIARKHYRENPDRPSLSSEFSDSQISSSNAHGFLVLIAALAEFNGYRLVLGVDELEKSYRTETHFDNLFVFIENLPPNVSLFVTGTPELLEGGGGEASISGNQTQLYERFIDNQIRLDEPASDELEDFLESILAVESAVKDDGGELGARSYTEQTDELGGVAQAVEQYLESESGDVRGFRGLLSYLAN